MKKLGIFISMLSLLFMGACADLNLPTTGGNTTDITDVTDKITSIDQQITSMQGTLDLLKKTDEELRAAIDELKKSGANPEAVKTIETKLETLEKKIAELEDALKNTTDWASATFATLQQYNELSDALASLTEAIKNLPANGGSSSDDSGNSTDLTAMIEECKTSMQGWVNEKLTGYYTIAEAKAVLETLQASITAGDSALQAEVDALEEELGEMEESLTAAYKKAIEEALKNNGTIPPSADPDDANGELDSSLSGLAERIVKVESKLLNIEGQLDKLVGMVQSVNWTLPANSEGIVASKMRPFQNSSEIVRLSLIVSPKRVASSLAENHKDVLSMLLIEHTLEVINGDDGFEVETIDYAKPINTYSIPFSTCTADPLTGIITVDLPVKDIPEELFINRELSENYFSAMVCISDGNTELLSDPVYFEPHYNYITYPTDYFPEGYYDHGGYYSLNKKGTTWELENEDYGISADDEIIAIGTDLNGYAGSDDWMTVSWDESTNKITISTTDNTAADSRDAYVTIMTKESSVKIHYRQYCEEGKLDVAKTEFNFPYNGELDEAERTLIIQHPENTSITVEEDYEWIDVWKNNYGTYTELTFSVERQWEISETASREGTVTILNGRGKTAEIKITQDLLTADNLKITVDNDELVFPYSGGTKKVTLTHPANAEIRIDGDIWVDEEKRERVNETTSILTIDLEKINYQPDEQEYTIYLRLRDFGFDFDMNQTEIEIKIIQEALSADQAKITVDETALHFEYNGGEKYVTLTHVPIDDYRKINVRDESGNCELYIEPSEDNQTSSILHIYQHSNPDVRDITGKIIIYLEGFEEIVTEIMVTQDAVPVE